MSSKISFMVLYHMKHTAGCKIIFYYFGKYLLLTFALERKNRRYQDIQQNSQRPYVAFLVVLVWVIDDLWGNIMCLHTFIITVPTKVLLFLNLISLFMSVSHAKASPKSISLIQQLSSSLRRIFQALISLCATFLK